MKFAKSNSRAPSIGFCVRAAQKYSKRMKVFVQQCLRGNRELSQEGTRLQV